MNGTPIKHPSKHLNARCSSVLAIASSLDISKERHRAAMPTNCPTLPGKYLPSSDKWISVQLDKKETGSEVVL